MDLSIGFLNIFFDFLTIVFGFLSDVFYLFGNFSDLSVTVVGFVGDFF